MRTALPSLTLAVLAFAAGCSDPAFEPGLTCSETGQCPPGHLCDVAGGNVCREELAGCGDGTPAGREVCDDGNRVSADGCRADCLKIEICGDGEVDAGEQCDDGNVVDDDACSITCTAPTCHDEVRAGDEQCDDGNRNDSDACVAECRLASCHDGHLWSGEEACDDGDRDDTDGCVGECQLAACHDGHVWAGEEECDDANLDDSDGCVDACVAAACGDGHVWAGEEGCDDGNTVATDGCTGLCRPATCGDGILWAGEETCDDGNTAAGDDCPTSCEPARCGDGFTWIGHEVCDHASLCTAACDAPVQISAGDSHTCFLRPSGALTCWGKGSWGVLGYGNQTSIGDTEPASAAGSVALGGSVVQVSSGRLNTCALLSSGALRCWGYGPHGAVGLGNTLTIGDTETPQSVAPVATGGQVVQVSAGQHVVCARLASGDVRCWGISNSGMLGRPGSLNIGDDELPSAVPPVTLGGGAIDIAVGWYHACAVLVGGTVRCWGMGHTGVLGYGNANTIGDDETPASAGDVNIGAPARSVVVGTYHTCVLLENGKVRCWGSGGNGQLGYGNANTIGDDELPVAAGDVPVGGDVVQLAAGSSHTCALLTTGAVRCWGNSNQGTLGYGNRNTVGVTNTPAMVGDVPLGGTAVSITAGSAHTCAVLTNGAVRCWGDGGEGQLGHGNIEDLGANEPASAAGNVPL